MLKERLKAILPFLTHRDAASTIVFVRRIGRIKASLLSATPSLVFGSDSFPGRASVRLIPYLDFLTTPTAAASHVSAKVGRQHDFLIPAVADAKPACVMPLWPSINELCDNQFSEPLADTIFKLGHDCHCIIRKFAWR